MSERRGTKGLELWCRRITEGYPGVKIDNMTTSWRDGLAFCALIHHFRPDLIEFTELNKEDVYHNNELAFRVAEQYLGIPALLEPEDMVEYTVPDRLSILTYLSQFYQAFAVGQGKSGGRLAPKRAQTTPDHGIVSPTSTSPPTKVAHIGAGKMRRDPCAKCGLPVFIAERLNVGKLLYHRTCFRCARCNSQLTLANYYETESAQFCCEICPDEEKSTAKKGAVLNRSVSDEEKSASLTTFSELDSYSAQFESALEFPNDTELKKNFTLKSQDNTVYSAARSHFFKSQMENSDSGNEEDIPPDLPKSVPPPKEVNKVSMDNSDSSFSKVKETLNHVNKSSVSEDKQNVTAQNNLVTKDNTRSPSIVKARMKLFEDNNKNSTTVFNQKSDVYNISSRFSNSDRNKNIKVPSSEVVVPMPASKHEAKVVSLEDLEDFDNISRKDVNLEFEKSDSNKESLEPTKIIKESSDSLDLQHSDIENADKKHILEVNNLETENEPISYTISSEDSVIEISNGTTSSSKKDVEAHHSDSGSVVVIDDSYSNSTEEVNNTSTQKENITDEVIPKIIHESEVDIEISTQTKECSTVNKSEELSIVNTSVNRNALDINEQTDPSVNVDTNVVSENEKDITEINTSAIYSSSHCEYSSNNKSEELSIPNTSVNSNALCVNEETNRYANVDINIASKNEKDIEINNLAIDSSSNHDPIIIKEDLIQSVNSDINNLTNKQMIEKQESYPEDLNPFGDPEENNSKLYQSTLNPFGEYDVDDKTNDKALNIQKSIPVASPRMKKKILPTEEDKLITGTPDCLKRIYIERISVNPFEECDDVEQQEAPPQPADRRKKISAPKISLTPWNYKNLENKTQKQSLNPFESDDESSNAVEETQGKEASEFAISAPVPKPRISLTSAPEPKPRDHSFGLSLSSRSSFGGSNESSLSSAGAIGSARKKKPAPRPPVPTAFRAADNNTADSGGSSLTSSPSQSVVPSPHLQVKHRKTKRAPLPPTSTSTPLFSEENVIKPYTGNVSPIKFPETTEVKDSVNENDVEQEKSFKDEANRNRQSQDLQYVQSPTSNDNNANICAPNKSTFGKWKRHKGKAPARPIPQRRSIKSLPLADIRRELDVIEIQQQGLEKQGVKIEQIIREKCEGDDDSNPDAMLPIEVEDLILQLFELVNEKNELFRKQAELMYLRRQQRLEEEHADVEYQIRCLMLQPEANKTDSDKAMEEELIQRLVDIVERRNEIIECLELDRVREAEEDDSINNQINLYTQSREIEKEPTPKKEKKHKKDKKINKLLNTLKHKEKDKYKIDADKDVDESETNTSVEKKKKKKFNLF